jgi:hypothetical protein
MYAIPSSNLYTNQKLAITLYPLDSHRNNNNSGCTTTKCLGLDLPHTRRGWSFLAVGETKLKLKQWLKETINNSPMLPQETKDACNKIIDEKKT